MHADNFTMGGMRQVKGICVHVMAGLLPGTDSWFAKGKVERLAAQIAQWNEKPLGPRPVKAYASGAHYGTGMEYASSVWTVHQWCREADEAYHAGIVTPSAFPCKLVQQNPGVNPNTYLIGIENAGFENTTWPDKQLEILVQLIAQIAKGHSLPVTRDTVVGHNEVSGDHAHCPGLAPLGLIVERAAAVLATL